MKNPGSVLTKGESPTDHNHSLRETFYEKQQVANLTHNAYKIAPCPVNVLCKPIIFTRAPCTKWRKRI